MKQHIRSLLLAYLIVLLVNLAANSSYYLTGAGNWKSSVLFSLAVTTVAWTGFALLQEFVLKGLLDWKTKPTRSFAISLILAAVYGGFIMWFFMKATIWVMKWKDFPSNDYIINILFCVLLTVIFTLINMLRYFLDKWKKGIEESGELQQAVLNSRFENLKRQVNPHFLFNALNTLTTLIPEDSQKAVAFVHQLSRMLRYGLQYEEKNTVDLGTELNIVHSFLYVCQERFKDKLHSDIRVGETDRLGYIATYGLLMLVENAIKHNEISTEKPLYIRIYTEPGYVCVSNNLQPKTVWETSHGLGLRNLQLRYHHIAALPVIIRETPQDYIVQIPLMLYDHIDH